MSDKVLKSGINKDVFIPSKQWTWKLIVTYDDKSSGQTISKEVGYPLTISFNITRNTSASANNATFEIYNLAPGTRSSEAFFQDKYNTDTLKRVQFSAGYEGNLITCFEGYVQESYTTRQGVDVITRMQCLDMGTNATQYVCMTFEAGTTRQQAYDTILQNCQGLTPGLSGVLDGIFETPLTVAGSPLEVLNQITGGHTFVDSGKVNTLQNNECLNVGVTVLRPDTGLISTPERRDSEITCNSVMNPSIMVGQLLEIQDPVFTDFNGTYMVFGFNHSGMISGTQAGQRITSYNLLIGDYLPQGSYDLVGTPTNTFNKVVENNKVEAVNGTIEAGAVDIYRYIHAHNGEIPNMKITKNISAKELMKNDNTAQDILKELSIEKISNCITIAKKLQNFMNANTPGQKIIINSGWRSTANNARLKNAAKESAHLSGLAIDFQYSQVNTSAMYYKYYKQFWDKFTYLFRVSPSSAPVIHVQATLGAGGAKRSSKSLA